MRWMRDSKENRLLQKYWAYIGVENRGKGVSKFPLVSIDENV